MLFNSYEYILAFLPITVLVFLLVGNTSKSWALNWLILASVFFYAWWRPFNLLIIGPSLLVNFAVARALLSLAADQSRSRTKNVVLALGIVFNLAVLGFFKYANFSVTVANDLAGTNFVFERIILPLGISFITFQKIAFLIDVAGRRVQSFTVREFLLFVMFFPQLIAGPIVHFREMMPQFRQAPCRFDAPAYAAGLTLFCFGLFKKVVLADGMAEYVSPVYAFAAAGQTATFLQSWIAAVGFTLQIYFDFAGYSDMACGAALFFGVRLPVNFDSPLQTTNIIDFWARWHKTLTRFLTAYIFNPLALAMTRRRAAKGLPTLMARRSHSTAFLVVLSGPTLATMLLSGLWHGAGYTFLLWGLMHGFYLVVNHAWRQYGPQTTGPAGAGTHVANFLGFALTFLGVAVAMVFFRAPDISSAIEILKGMTGLHGMGLPERIAAMIGTPGLGPMMLLDGAVHLRTFATGVTYLAGLLVIALLMPNSLQVLFAYQPALEAPTRPSRLAIVGPLVRWRPTVFWIVLIGSLVAISMIRLTGKSEFLYWQF